MTTQPSARRRAPGMTPEQRREAIVNAALPLVAEHGAAVTTAQIARAAGIGEATIFRVFDDKEALLEACILRALDPANVLSQLHAIPLDQPLADRLIDAVEALDAHGGRIGAVIGALRASGMPNRRPRPRNTDQPASDAPDRRPIAAATDPAASGTHDRRPISAATDPAASSIHDRRPLSAATDLAASGTHDRRPLSGDAGRAGAHARPLASGDADRSAPDARDRRSSSGDGGLRALSASREEAQAATRQAVLELVEPDRDSLRLSAEAVTDAFLGVITGRGRGPDLPAAELVDLFLYGALARP
ncbi:TetR family transcriptional regulator [Actinoplanes sp. NPDC048796]|uniref:TetR family transcriptional regulator n=1 Tax=Actinoplanes sp. NPDC048796 TaxID=3155640 RepID=UPI003401C3A6